MTVSSRVPDKSRWGDQKGSVMIMVAIGIVAILAFAILAIDGSTLMTTKVQLQNAADAAALAGASGLAGTGSQDLARERALAIASSNVAVQERQTPVVITENDVTFPTATKCRVVTHRTQATGDPLRTYFLRLTDLNRPNTADVQAVAVAEVVEICGTNCVKPWSIPDRWNDLNHDDQWEVGEPYDPIGTGYLPPGDVGVHIVLKIGSPGTGSVPGQFYPIDLPPLGYGEAPIPGGDQYRTWIRECEPYPVSIGDSLQTENGNMVGPTNQGVDSLIALDPGAYWDDATNTIMGSAFGLSPRAIKVAFFNPTEPPRTGRNHVHVVKIGAFFIESRPPGHGSQVNSRFMDLGTPGIPCDPGAPPSFLHGLALVE